MNRFCLQKKKKKKNKKKKKKKKKKGSVYKNTKIQIFSQEKLLCKM